MLHLDGYTVSLHVSLEEAHVWQDTGHDIMILMVGGNDIDNGMSPGQLADRVCSFSGEGKECFEQCV